MTVQRWLHLPRVRALVDGIIVAGATLLVPTGLGLAHSLVEFDRSHRGDCGD